MDTHLGALIVDKPAGWTSHDVVNRVRRIAGTTKVGHLGTLDPSATGVLPLLIGRATRLARFFTRADKRYVGTIQFGFATDTYDAEGTPLGPPQPVVLNPDRAAASVRALVGARMQQPPAISAKKIKGVPAYKLARQGKSVDLPAVPVEIYDARLLRCGADDLDVEIHCSAGTYVRSIAHELGQELGCGAHLKSLRRTAAGNFSIDSAYTLERLAEMKERNELFSALIGGRALLPEIPAETVDETSAAQIRQGRTFRVSPFGPAREAPLVRAMTPQGDLLAIGEAKLPGVYQPILVL